MSAESPASGGGAGLDLTNAQRLIWASQQLHADAPLYNMAFLWDIEGAIDEEVFARAFDELLAGSDAMRLVVTHRSGVPSQTVLERVDFELPVVDVSGAEDPIEACRAWALERCAATLVLDSRLFDSALIRLGPDRYAWFLNQHHLITDGWSYAVTYERMEGLYQALVAEASPPEPSPQFADYLTTTNEAAGEGPGLSVSAVPALYGRRPTRAGTANTRVISEVSSAQTAGIDRLAGQPGFQALTPDLSRFRILATAFFAYLFRVSAQNLLAVGAPAHNRMTADHKQTAGLFMEVFPLEVEVEDVDTFRTLHGKVAAAADAFMRSARPGGGAAGVNRSINTLFNFILGSFGTFAGHRAHTEWLHPGHADAEHHLRLLVHDFDGTGRPTLMFDCNEDVLGPVYRDAIPAHFLRILDAMLEDVDTPIASVKLTSAEGRANVLKLGQGPVGGDQQPSVVSAFRQKVDSNPEAIALVAGDRQWSYGELWQAARKVASRIPEGSRVGVCLPRSPESVIAILGVLLAGAAYVPIDPDWPAARARFVADDANCSLILSDQPRDLGPDTLLLSDLGPADRAREVSIDPTSLAYLLYTSGSTGRPKGVMINHASLSAYVHWASDFYTQGRSLTFPLFTPLTFDLTVTSVFVPLATGGTIVVYPPTAGPADTSVQQVFDDDAVDIVKLTPSHLALITDRDPSAGRIKQLIVGGEDLATSVARTASDLFGGRVAIYNEYGPTEATVGCIVHTFDPSGDSGTSVPIGRPITNRRSYVLDDRGHPVPFGVPGNLWVGGDGLAEGYVGAEALTAERFRAFPDLGEERLYDTGDRARLRPDGVFEFLGRSDDQVKVRGARIELGEVEGALATHPQVGAAAARVWASDDTGGRLAAYFVSDDALSSSELRSFLMAAVPEQMVPSLFVRLDEIPLTRNGKIDRSALPEPAGDRTPAEAEFVAPRSHSEEALADIWQRVLGMEQVGVLDNFFDLGGDSIMAIQIVARAQSAGLPVSLQGLFESLTVEGLAQQADTGSAGLPSDQEGNHPQPQVDQTELARLRELLQGGTPS